MGKIARQSLAAPDNGERDFAHAVNSRDSRPRGQTRTEGCAKSDSVARAFAHPSVTGQTVSRLLRVSARRDPSILRRSTSAGSSLLYGVSARQEGPGCHQMGFERGSADQSTSRGYYPRGWARSDRIHRPRRRDAASGRLVLSYPKTLDLSFSSCLGSKFEFLLIDQHAMHDHRELAGEGDFCLLHPHALGELHRPALEP